MTTYDNGTKADSKYTDMLNKITYPTYSESYNYDNLNQRIKTTRIDMRAEVDKMKKRFLHFGLTTLICLIYGCSQVESVKSDKALWGGYLIGGKYVLNTDVFILKVRGKKGTFYALSPPASYRKKEYFKLYYSAPFSFADQKIIDGVAYHLPVEVVGSLPKDTVLEVTDITRKHSRPLFFRSTISTKAWGRVNSNNLENEKYNLRNLSKVYRTSLDETPPIEYLTEPDKVFLRCKASKDYSCEKAEEQANKQKIDPCKLVKRCK